MSKRKQVDTPDTPFHYQVVWNDGMQEKTETYYGFGVVKNIRAVKPHLGLICVQCEDVVEWYFYDREYPEAIAEFRRYCREGYDDTPTYKLIKIDKMSDV